MLMECYHIHLSFDDDDLFLFLYRIFCQMHSEEDIALMENQCFWRIHIFCFVTAYLERSSRKSNHFSSIVGNRKDDTPKKSILVLRYKNPTIHEYFFTESSFLHRFKHLSRITTIADSPLFDCLFGETTL